jgi:glutamate racemase
MSLLPPILPASPIGVFDSGVGGLSVLRAIRARLPAEDVIYFADQCHVPYGPRTLDEVRAFSAEITRFLIAQGAKLVVVACNTASAAALHSLRRQFPEVAFVGMEPAVKPAAETTRSGVVGVLATPATFQGELYASVVERFAQGVIVLQDPCPGLVAQIEAGALDAPETRRILERAIQPMLARGVDTLVMGCTHYPFVIPLIAQISGPGVRVIDPAPAIARQVERLLAQQDRLNGRAATGQITFFTSGAASALQDLLPRLLGEEGVVVHLDWAGKTLGVNWGNGSSSPQSTH